MSFDIIEIPSGKIGLVEAKKRKSHFWDYWVVWALSHQYRKNKEL